MKSVRNTATFAATQWASRIHKAFTRETLAEPYRRPAAPIRVAIGRQSAEILFAGSAAGNGGVIQISLGLPKGIAGSRGGILLTAGDATNRKAIVSCHSVSAPVISIREGTCRSAQKSIDAFLEDRLRSTCDAMVRETPATMPQLPAGAEKPRSRERTDEG